MAITKKFDLRLNDFIQMCSLSICSLKQEDLIFTIWTADATVEKKKWHLDILLVFLPRVPRVQLAVQAVEDRR